MKTYRPWEPHQTYLLPPSTKDWLPEGHLAHFVLEVVEELDLSAIEQVLQDADPRGTRPFAPRMMVALLLYAYSVGVYSSRAMARETWTDVAFRYISGDAHPHFATIALFRVTHLEALGALFTQVLSMCARAGLVKLGHVAIDGTKIQANASKHKAMSYDRMKETEKRLKAEVDEMLARAAATDGDEDAEFGPDKDGTELPAELARREGRRTRIAQLMRELEAEAKAARTLELKEQAARAEATASEARDDGERKLLERRAAARDRAAKAVGGDPSVIPGSDNPLLPHHAVPHEKDGTPKAKAQRNFTDGDSRIMTTGGTFVQGYNCQAAVDEEAQVIVAQLVTNQAPDTEHFVPVMDAVRQNTGRYPNTSTADAGYWSAQNAQYCLENGIDAYISTRRRRHEESPNQPAIPLANPDAKAAMDAKVTAEEGRKIYAKRKWVVEPVFGQMKEVRRFRRFSMRGIGKARPEFSLVCTAHNLLKLWRNPAK